MSGSTKAVAQRISVFADSRGNTCSEEDDSEGRYVLFTDHAAEIARLRAELENAAAAALANMSLACEKEREADALRVDAMRYRWLCEDHADAATRRRRNDLLEYFRVRSYSTNSTAIDAAISMGADA